MSTKICPYVGMVAKIIVIIGAINWGLIGFFNFNLVGQVLTLWPWAQRLVYDVVGIAGILLLIRMTKVSCCSSGAGDSCCSGEKGGGSCCGK